MKIKSQFYCQCLSCSKVIKATPDDLYLLDIECPTCGYVNEIDNYRLNYWWGEEEEEEEEETKPDNPPETRVAWWDADWGDADVN